MSKRETSLSSETFISVCEVCYRLGICKRTFFKNAATYPFPVYHVGKKYYIPREPFDKIRGIDTTKQTKDV